MLTASLILAFLSATLHLFIFYLEAIAWEGELARKTFATGTPEQAKTFAFYAFNQGFYNLFLALQALTGIVLVLLGHPGIGMTLVVAGTASMLAAATVLFLASPKHRVAAIKQGTLPALAVLTAVISLL